MAYAKTPRLAMDQAKSHLAWPWQPRKVASRAPGDGYKPGPGYWPAPHVAAGQCLLDFDDCAVGLELGLGVFSGFLGDGLQDGAGGIVDHFLGLFEA
jgi:hypothetical protein